MKKIPKTLQIRHFKLLEKAFFANLSRLYDGEGMGIGLDSKRPFGNSRVDCDILEIIHVPRNEWNDEWFEYAMELYDELPQYLKDKYT